MKYEDLLREWLDNYIKISVKLRTYTRYKEIIQLHIIPLMGNYEINEISPIMLQKCITKLLNTKSKKTLHNLSTNTINGIISVIKNSFKYALLLNYINEDITLKIKRPKTEEKKVDLK